MPQTLATLLLDRLGISDFGVVPNRYSSDGYKIVCSGADALERWKQLRNLATESGYWPVILGNDKEASAILGVADSEHAEPMNQILYRVATETADGWLKERREANINGFKDGYGEGWIEAQKQLHGPWPDKSDGLKSFTIPLERAGLGPPKPKVTIGLFPVQDCWQVPAYLNFGGWNECPEPIGHVLMWKMWHEKYGAELVGMSFDVVEMYATRPPSTRDEALALAEEQYLYCEDIVIQGTQTIENLAAGLQGNNLWYFWWD